jgi:signal transduction histidine kinase
MKLLGERVLGGEVRFTSSATGGTTFSLTLPRLPPPPAALR